MGGGEGEEGPYNGPIDSWLHCPGFYSHPPPACPFSASISPLHMMHCRVSTTSCTAMARASGLSSRPRRCCGRRRIDPPRCPLGSATVSATDLPWICPLGSATVHTWKGGQSDGGRRDQRWQGWQGCRLRGEPAANVHDRGMSPCVQQGVDGGIMCDGKAGERTAYGPQGITEALPPHGSDPRTVPQLVPPPHPRG